MTQGQAHLAPGLSPESPRTVLPQASSPEEISRIIPTRQYTSQVLMRFIPRRPALQGAPALFVFLRGHQAAVEHDPEGPQGAPSRVVAGAALGIGRGPGNCGPGNRGSDRPFLVPDRLEPSR